MKTAILGGTSKSPTLSGWGTFRPPFLSYALAYMTEKCQEENGINVDLDAKFRSVGKIVKVFQDTDSEKQYALLGEEDSRGVKNEVLFVVQLVEEEGQYKIDNFRYEQLHVH